MGLSHTVSGDIASFRTPSRVPIESLKIHFLPKQEGSGDPSPQNIRNIVGWTGCNLFKAKKNLINISDSNIIYSGLEQTNGTFINTITDGRDDVQIYLEGYKIKNGNYTLLTQFRVITGIVATRHIALSFTVPSSCEDITHFCIKHNGNRRDFRVYFPVKLPVGASLCCSLDITGVDVKTVGGFSFNNVQLQVGSESALELYEGSTLSLSWSDHGVEYGGYIDPVKGEIWKEYDEIVFDGSDADAFTYVNTSDSSGISRHYFNTKVLDRIVKNNSTSTAYSDSATPTSNTFDHRTTICYYIGTPTNQVILNITATECDPTAESFNSYLHNHPVQLVYKLATPVLVATFNPVDFQTFLDYNNFWSDANDITEVTYAVTESKDILDARKLIMDGSQPHLEDASGTIASFSTDMKAPVKELKAYFTPVQEGSGDPSPENERPIRGWTEANISMVDAYEFYQGGLADLTGEEVNINTRIRTDYIPYDGSQSFVLDGVFDADDRFRSLYWYDSNKEFIVSGGAGHDFPYNFWVGNHPNYAYFRVVVYKSDNTKSISPNGKRLVFPKETYPIEFPAMKNLLDVTQYGRHDGGKEFVASDGIVSFDEVNGGNSCIVWGSQTFPAGTYTLNAKVSGDGTIGFRLLCSSASCGGTYNSYYGGYFINSVDNNSKITFTTTESFNIGICLLSNSQHEKESGMAYDIQLERGSSATPYEPYGTVYGGYIDLIHGKIYSEWAYGKISDYSWSYDTYNGSNVFKISTPDAVKNWVQEIKVISDVFKTLGQISSYSEAANREDSICRYISGSVSSGENRIFIKCSAHTTVSAFLEEYGDYHLCYKLAVPIEYDLTPQQIKTLKGLNNIWSDTKGTIDVKYWTH